MIITDSTWLERYALYRERLMVGPEGRFADTSTELPCLQTNPSGIRWARHGDLLPFLRWASEGANDPLGLPGRYVMASRFTAITATAEDLEISGVLGIEHDQALWQSGLAVLALVCEWLITGDEDPYERAWATMRGLRRLGGLVPGYGETASPKPDDGWGYMLRADEVDDSTLNSVGVRTSNYCDWLADPNSARGLEPSAVHYLGMLATLILTRRALLASAATPARDLLVSEIEARVRACHLFLSDATHYRIRRNDGSDVAHRPLAFSAAWPLAQLSAEVSGRQPEEELSGFHVADLAVALVEFDRSADRDRITQDILRSLANALWLQVTPVLLEALTPDLAAVLIKMFPDVWLRDVIFFLRAQVETFISSQLASSVRTKLGTWLDHDPLDSSSTTDLAQSWWIRELGRSVDPTLMPEVFDTVSLRLMNVIGTDQLTFPSLTLHFQTPSGGGQGEQPTKWDIPLPAVTFTPGNELFKLTLTKRALGEEFDDAETPPTAAVKIRRASDTAPGSTLAPDYFGPAPALTFSPLMGDQLASGHWDGIVRLRDARQGANLAQFDGQGGAVLSLAFTPDGQHLAAGLRTGPVQIWPATVRSSVNPIQLAGHEGGTFALASQTMTTVASATTRPARKTHESSEQLVLASAGADQTIRLWDAVRGTLLREWVAHAGPVRALSFLAPGPGSVPIALASAGDDGSVRLWNPLDGSIIKQLVTTGVPVRVMSVSPDASLVVTGGPDGSVRVWEMSSGLELAADHLIPGGVTALAISPDGMQLTVGAGDGSVRMYALQALKTGSSDCFARVDPTSPGFGWMVLAGNWQTDGDRLLASSDTGLLAYIKTPPGPDYGIRCIVRADADATGDPGLAGPGVLARMSQGEHGISGYQASLVMGLS